MKIKKIAGSPPDLGTFKKKIELILIKERKRLNKKKGLRRNIWIMSSLSLCNNGDPA